MRRTDSGSLVAVRTEGGLISPDIITALASPKADLPGLDAPSYHLDGGRLGEAITRSWNRMRGEWERFSEARQRVSEGDPATGLTRERLLLPLFAELGYGRLVPARGLEVGGRSYAVSHLWNRTPIHLVGCGLDLDHRTARVAGASQASPHGLVQELLNRSDEFLWGMVSNGLRLRVMRDNRSLTRQAYVEFDLEGIFGGELYPDFVVLWLLCHQSRVEAAQPEECWLERWSSLGWEQGARALDSLREGVQKAIESLGRGFLAHRSNAGMRGKLKAGELSTQDFYRQLLRLVYRLLFLFVAEDRGALHPPGSPAEAIETYRDFYSTRRLRTIAEQIRGSAHADLFAGLRHVMRLLGTLGSPELGLPALGSFLWSEEAIGDLAGCDIANTHLLEAVRELAFTRRGRDLWHVDYRNLGSEELGSVYESLLELHPEVDVDGHSFSLEVSAGHERKTTGSYYTHHSLVRCLLDSALDPVLDEAASSADPEAAILGLKVCDPATGSGHFLIAAAHRIARRLASARTGDEEPSPEAMRKALRDVVGRCLYGVDVNPMAVELCKVSLWMEALEPGRPLSFLESRIRCGNSLLGTTPALMAGGIPDEAFGVLTGDDKKVAAQHRKRNREEREGNRDLVDREGRSWIDSMPEVPRIEACDDSSLAGVRDIEERFRQLLQSDAYLHAKMVADAWCAAFAWPRKQGQSLPPMTHGLWSRLRSSPESVPQPVLVEVERIAESYRFLHWHIAFPEVFAGESGGFDVVLGNPPWEQTEFKEQEWFADRRPDIANAAGAVRKRMIAELATNDPDLYRDYLDALRHGEGSNALIRDSARYPLCGRGKINTYSIFAELGRNLLSGVGRMGMIVPSGIATDDTTRFFFADLVDKRSLVSLYDFENREKLFPDVDSRYRFCLLTLSGKDRTVEAGAEFRFFAYRAEDLADPERRFRLSAEDFALMNPNTRTCPIFRTRRDAELTRAIYRRVPVLIREGEPEVNPWGVSFRQGLFNMTNDSGLFRTRDDLESQGFRLEGNRFGKGSEVYLPLYEAKMIHHFDHRWATYDGEDTRDVRDDEKRSPGFQSLPRYWVAAAEVDARLEGRWNRGWLLGWRDICRSTDERTVIASIVPRVGVGHKLPLMFPSQSVPLVSALYANLCSLPLDYLARQKVGGTSMTYFYLKQLPIFPPSTYDAPCAWAEKPGQTLADWILPRVLELVYTAHDMEPFARDCGYSGPPFAWVEERRFQLRCELDAAFFHLYGISRDDVDYIMETFPIVKRHDEERYGEYRTKARILEMFDGIA